MILMSGYFIVKSCNRENLELSVEQGVWATQRSNEAKLNEAFDSVENVILIFSVNRTRHFQGCAKMTSKIGGSVGGGNWKYAHGSAHYGRNFSVKWLKEKSNLFTKTKKIDEQAELLPDGTLLVGGQAIAVIYFRAGYAPTDYPSESEIIASSGSFVEEANAADLIQRRQRSEFQSSVKGTLSTAIKANPDLVPSLLTLAMNDAMTYDKATKSGGPNGSVRFSSEISRPENKGLSAAMNLLEEAKKEIDSYSKVGACLTSNLGGQMLKSQVQKGGVPCFGPRQEKWVDVPVYAAGTGVKPAEIARQGLEEAKRKNMDVVIVDTAGRLQKLILNSDRDIFEERTEVDLKDKWRNMIHY
ncbi:unnamed protein product [Camellia sinensis]